MRTFEDLKLDIRLELGCPEIETRYPKDIIVERWEWILAQRNLVLFACRDLDIAPPDWALWRDDHPEIISLALGYRATPLTFL